MVKFQSFTQFSVDHMIHTVVLFLCQFTTFAYCGINSFISFTPKCILAILQRNITYHYTSCEFLTSAFANDLSRESEVSRTLSVFCRTLSMLSRLPLFVLQFPDLSAPLPRLWRPLQARQLQLISTLQSCSTAFSVLWQGPSTCHSFRFCFVLFLFFSLRGPLGR